MRLKRIDHFTTLLISFIFFLFLLFLYLFKIDNDIKNYGSYHDQIVQLKITDKEFDNFLLQKLSFINYDQISQRTNTFETILQQLKQSRLSSEFGPEFDKSLTDIKHIFEEKRERIEYFKSNNAMVLNSMHYLFDLSTHIDKDPDLPVEIKKLTHKILFGLLQVFVKIDTIPLSVKQNLNQLMLYKKDKEPAAITLSYFFKHASLTLKNIGKFNDIHLETRQLPLYQTLENFHQHLDNVYQSNLFSQKMIALFAFISAFIIVLALIIVYRRSLRVKQKLMAFRFAVEHSDNSVVMTDVDKNIVYVNDVFERDSGYSYAEAIGQNPRILKSDMIDQSYYDNLNDTLKQGKKWEGEFVNRRKDGSLFHEKASIVPIFIDNELVNYLAIKLDISKYVEQQKQMDHLAYHDALTGLPNRIYFEEHLKHILEVARRKQAMIAVLFIDLDRFKVINDTLGHHIGDEMLKTVAERVQSVLRRSDIIARIGGDEFVVILETLKTKEEAAHISDKIITAVKRPMIVASHTLNTTASIGIAIFPDDGITMQNIIKHADSAMYQAKKLGKNRYHYYVKQLSEDAHFRLQMEQALHHAIENNELQLFYQPQYDLKSKKIIGLEALLRWQNEALGTISPDHFIPVAEETGLIIEIGEFVFEKACRTFMQLQRSGAEIDIIAINVSSIQFRQNNFLNRLKHIIHTVGIAPQHIEIEITERYLMEYTESNLTVLEDLRKLGLKISIDDFGTGYSSMSYLKKLPIDTIKIDKSFIDEIASDSNDFEITKAIIALSSSLGYSVIAEGIETKEQENALLDLECNIGQGYYFSKPLSKHDIFDFV
ncbi:MAG: GGDEF domain-containing protein, partial [Epsilonproteobacteria bacterium]